MTEPAKKRTVDRTGPIDEYTAAARISRLLGQSAAELVDVEKTVRAAIAKRQAEIQESIGKLMARVPADKRDRIAKLVLAGGCELNGFELQPSNDPAPSAQPDEVPDADGADEPSRPEWLDAPAPPASPVVEVDTTSGKARRVGASRT